jgi:hypothetical protein
VEALRKIKADALGKTVAKRGKAMPKKKITAVRIIPMKKRLSLKKTSDAELSLAKPLKRTKKLALTKRGFDASGSTGA